VLLGDTDGNGLGEIIGWKGNDYANLIILERTGIENDFTEVYNAPRDGYIPLKPYSSVLLPIDVDGNHITALYRFLDDGSGQFNIFTIATRAGTAITDIYNSGSLLQAFSGDISALMSIGDTNGDGEGDECDANDDNDDHLDLEVYKKLNMLPAT